MGVNFPRRWTHLRESVEALRLLWAKDDVSYDGEFVKFPAVKLGPKPVAKARSADILGAHDPKYALKRVARYADGWCPGGLSVENARECIPQIKRMAREFGRDADKLEFSVLLMGGDGPSADSMKQYAEAGVTRLVVAAAGAVTGDGVKAVRNLASIAERGAKIRTWRRRVCVAVTPSRLPFVLRCGSRRPSRQRYEHEARRSVA